MSSSAENIVNIITVVIILCLIMILIYVLSRKKSRSKNTHNSKNNAASNYSMPRTDTRIDETSERAPTGICPACGSLNPPDNHFCEHCGSSLSSKNS